MVQDEMNTVTSPTSVATNHTHTYLDNTKNVNNPSHIPGINLTGPDPSGEKKKKVGNYIISKTIGEGSFAKVRLGYHLITQQMVAVKVINKREVLKRNYLRANLRREACMMQRMQHPHIIQLYEVMETENCYYIVMELIDGIEFVKYLSKKRSLDENETREYIRQICSAVDHMHKAKVVHRDIKLQNFMLDQNHNLTIIDFGLSNSTDERELLNTQCGSPAYAAPEIFAHQDYGAEVDIWSIGVNMYAMLAGKLPFKVENRSKNLAKLHACILKGFELPPFLSPDCQDLLCRLLDPAPAKRIKMSEIFTHPWLNYNCFPVEIIPYKPIVDLKEIKPHIVQYLVQKHEYAETDVIDAIVYRKPVALKAVYYLIEKRLQQGLPFPEADFTYTDNENQILKHTNGNNSSNNSNTNLLNSNRATPTNGSVVSGNGVVKHNSQLLPKRHVQASRSGSQKNVDFKSIFNNMNINSNTSGNTSNANTNLNRYGSNVSRESDRTATNTNHNNMYSNSPSPDFLANAMTPAKGSAQNGNNNAYSASTRNSRQTNYTDQRQQLHSTTSNYEVTPQRATNGSANSNNNTRKNEYRTDRYYVPVHSGNSNGRTTSVNDDYTHNINNYYTENNSRTTPTTSVTRNGSNNLRGLNSVYQRGSPERTLPKSSDQNYRPTSRISSSRPVQSEIGQYSAASDKANYDVPKYKVINYLAAKRSITSCEETNPNKNSSSIVKNRALHMGKAKIDLENQNNLSVGVSIKNIGNYIKTSVSRNNPEGLKSFNSLNIKTTSNLKNPNPSANIYSDKARKSATLVHRHSNPSSSLSNNHSSNLNSKGRTLQPNAEANALPRIRVQS